MGALNGRMAPLPYRVKGEVEDWNRVVDQLTRFRFQELDPASGRHNAFGWVMLNDPFDTEFTLPRVFFGEHLVALAMRIDAISVPASQVKLHLARRVRQRLQESGRERLPKSEVNSLKEDLIAELGRRSLPAIKLFEMVMDIESKRLWFFGKARPAVATFLELFHETFGMTLLPDSPFTIAQGVLTEEEMEGLLELAPAVFGADAA